MRLCVFFAALVAAGATLAAVPLPSSPDWSSVDNDFSTGGAFADIDGDGWLDLCTSNGNDMANNCNGIYFNSGGTIETVASWRSQDRGNFGHCYSGDVDGDGRPDLAVAYLGPDTSTAKLVARLYLNGPAGLDTVPAWRARDRHSSFDCCLGDFDLDADLDLAISAGNAYVGETDSARIYRNDGGTLDTLPCWTAGDGVPSDAVRFGDVDDDGDLDLFVGQRGKVSMYRNAAGALETSPSWVARADVGWVLRLALGDYDNDGLLDLAAASNGQLGDPNSIKVFHNSGGTLDTLAAFTLLASDDYSSCVAWADVNGDGWFDLAAGGWWEPVVVFENSHGVLGTTPAWSWLPSNPSNLVCEALVWGDVTNGHLTRMSEMWNGDGQRRLFTLVKRPIQFPDSITVDGTLVPADSWCWDPLAGWASFASPPPAGLSNVGFHYRYSYNPDLAVTNWDPSHGNHLFLNTAPSGITGPAPLPRTCLSARPNPGSGPVLITAPDAPRSDAGPLLVFGLGGALVARVPAASAGRWLWDGRNCQGQPAGPGVYLARPASGGPSVKLVRVARR